MALQGRDLARSEFFEALGITDHTYNVQKHLHPLIEAGWVEMTVPDRPRSRNQRYRLTKSGQLELAARLA